jgi:hypothetical protein
MFIEVVKFLGRNGIAPPDLPQPGSFRERLTSPEAPASDEGTEPEGTTS